MMFALGVVLFALAILVSVALHECGHMWVARATGMKVRRYFVGFGPTLWSTRRPNRLGETEYGVKAVPLGGFCDIAGMTSVDEMAPEDEPYAMYKQKVWKRVAVLFAGPGMNFVVGLVLVYGIAMAWGLPILNPPTNASIGGTSCVKSEVSEGQFGDCVAASPAATAGIQPGDVVVRVGATEIDTWEQMVDAIRKATGPVPFVVERDGATFDTVVDVTPSQRWITADATGPTTVGAIGVTQTGFMTPRYNPVTAVPATVAFTGELGVETARALAKLPTKVGALVRSIGGGERDPETPISVVGASILGGQTAERGLWMAWVLLLANINFVLGVVNLVPLLPLDGGHIAVAVFEKLRNMVRKARGLVPAAPVNYVKLMPATYVVVIALVGFTLLTVIADFVNPINPFQ
jgi:membrane-associated protease RseP (regulator of RpoE activity)